MSVKYNTNEETSRQGYCTVFSALLLGCLGRVDLHRLELHPYQKAATRRLHYDNSVKVAPRVKYPWWIIDCCIKQGVLPRQTYCCALLSIRPIT